MTITSSSQRRVSAYRNVTLQIPPLESWEQPLRWLTRSQRERFEEPEFYEMLQREISSRLLNLPANP